MNLYNNALTHRWNRWIRNLFLIPQMRKRLINKDVTILCNNCNGGIVSHDLGLRFNSPTVNLYFRGDGFFKFCEDLDFYLASSLIPLEERKDGDKVYPVFTLGEGEKKIELHFLHYNSFEDARSKWETRKARINKDNIFVVSAFFNLSTEDKVKRFEHLPQKNKVIFCEKEYPNAPHTFYIHGFPKGLNVLSLFHGLCGHRKIDQFDFVYWFNTGEYRRNY